MPQSKFLSVLLKVLYVLFCSVFTSLLWNIIWTSNKQYHTGWDGIADVLQALFIGFIAGLIAAIFSLKYLKDQQIKIGTLIFLMLNTGLFLYFALRPKPTNRIIKPQTGFLYSNGQTQNFESKYWGQLTYNPINSGKGMGIAALKFDEAGSIPFFGWNLKNEMAETIMVDSIILNRTLDDLSYAPPWFAPHHYKPDYQVIHFKVLSITPHYFEIEVNKYNGQSNFIGKDKVDFISWPEYILRASSIEFTKHKNFDFYAKPLEHSDVRKIGSNNILRPLRIKNNWVQVSFTDEMTGQKMIGWAKWQDQRELLVSINLFS